jgi:hypothetical protein
VKRSVVILAVAAAALPRPAAAQTLSSFELFAQAQAIKIFEAHAAPSAVGGDLPIAEASLATGPVGRGLAAIAWPGELGANAGSLVAVLHPGTACGATRNLPVANPPQPPEAACVAIPNPREAALLNDPVKAEARTGQNERSTYTFIPGVTMEAVATDDLVQANASIQKAIDDAGTTGPLTTRAVTNVSATRGTSEAFSRAQNVVMGGGLIAIDSVTTTAKATTDGVRGTGSSSTVVHGMSVLGVPVKVDDNGWQVGDPPQPLLKQVLKEQLDRFGATIAFGKPARELKDSSASMGAGAIVITIQEEDPEHEIVITIGGALAGARAAAAAEDGDLAALLGGTNAFIAASAGDALIAGGATAVLGMAASSPGTDAAYSDATGAPGGDGLVALDDAVPLGTRRPVGAGSIVLSLIAAAAIAAGAQRLGGSVFAARSTTSCPEDDAPAT